MPKLSLFNLSPWTGFAQRQNANNDLIEAALENTLSRDGTTPNQMVANIDMDGNQILNLPDALSNGEPVTFGQWRNAIEGIIPLLYLVDLTSFPNPGADRLLGFDWSLSEFNYFTPSGGIETSGVNVQLTDTGVSAGSYGTKGEQVSFTVDAKGRITGATNNVMFRVKDSVTTITNDTFTEDPHLNNLALDADSVYQFEAFLVASQSASGGDIKVRFFPTSGSILGVGSWIFTRTSQSTLAAQVPGSPQTSVISAIDPASSTVLQGRGYISTSTEAVPAMSILWAKNTNGGNDLTMAAGSYVKLTKVI